jgi:hypothetical protein
VYLHADTDVDVYRMCRTLLVQIVRLSRRSLFRHIQERLIARFISREPPAVVYCHQCVHLSDIKQSVGPTVVVFVARFSRTTRRWPTQDLKRVKSMDFQQLSIATTLSTACIHFQGLYVRPSWVVQRSFERRPRRHGR